MVILSLSKDEPVYGHPEHVYSHFEPVEGCHSNSVVTDASSVVFNVETCASSVISSTGGGACTHYVILSLSKDEPVEGCACRRMSLSKDVPVEGCHSNSVVTDASSVVFNVETCASSVISSTGGGACTHYVILSLSKDEPVEGCACRRMLFTCSPKSHERLKETQRATLLTHMATSIIKVMDGNR
jgi:ribosomal protein S27E